MGIACSHQGETMHKFMSRVIVAGAIAFMPALALAEASPVGAYKVVGTNPGGGGAYTGTVTVTETGDTYAVEWVVAGQTSTGTGVFYQDVLSVAGSLGQDQFVFIMKPDGKGLSGLWATVGAQTTGTETWQPQ